MQPISNIIVPTLQARKGFMGIYVHYPFCYQKCDYCDFYSEGIGASPSSNKDLLFETYRKEFLGRKNRSAELKQSEVDTIFIGGGTPSKASARNWKELIHFFRNELPLSTNTEISIETNPEDLSEEYIQELAEAGFNRLNVGIQTRSPDGLYFLGRYFEEQKYNQIETLFSNSKIKRLGIDLMYGIPNVSKDLFFKDLEYFLNLNINHISLYSLTLESGTSYSRKVKEKSLASPNEDMQKEILECLPDYMRNAGYVWYEVSNYCRGGEYSRHNLRYWMYESYMGIGPGAHGFLDKTRYGNARSTLSYLKYPMRAKLEIAEPRMELALSLFRLFLPLDLPSFLQLHLNERDEESMLKHIEGFAKKGLCFWDGRTFRWEKAALLILDDLISTLATAD